MRKSSVGADLDSYFRDVRRFAPLRREEEHDLAQRYRAGNFAAGHKLVTANLRFVVKVAGEYRSSGLPIADLVQEGNLGLMKAVSKFDPDRGLRLISYAVWWIRAFIQAYVLKSWSLVRIGTTQAQRRLFFTLGKEYRYYRERGEDGEAPDAEVLARRLGVSPGEVIEMRQRICARDASIDAPIFTDSDVSLMDRLEANGESGEDAVLANEDALLKTRHVRIALSRLTDRERLIMERRALTDEPVSLQCIAGELRISGERVRQLEIRARAKIHATLDSFAPRIAA
jgi:RNA polymerase sigma-32 factor